MVFGRNVVKQTFRKGFHDFLQLVAQRVYGIDLLEILQKLVIKL